MYNKIKSIIYFLVLIIFLFSVIFYYFSEENKKIIYKNRINIFKNIENEIVELPVLISDTENIIEYRYRESKKNKEKIFLGTIKKRLEWKENL